ncbi:MAG: M67 family metallopeptidase [Rhizonema sp. NSF051]|nr:M67 family metallopeptidase [Rhizonema sp. NSF051]
MIKLSQEHLQIICAHAESTYPEECCGIMFGYLALEVKTVVEVMPTDNAWSAETAIDFSGDVETNHDASLYSKRRRYAIAPSVMLQAQRKARDRHLNIIGIYHSHPDYPNIPSEFDRLYAWQEYSYVIISVQNGKSADAKSWSLDDNHQFQPEVIQKCS